MPVRPRPKCWSRASFGALCGRGRVMSSLSPKTNFHPGWSAEPLARRIALARLSLGLERLLPSLWPGTGFLGLYIALALFGVFAFIPWPLQALLLAAGITATGLSLYQSFT